MECFDDIVASNCFGIKMDLEDEFERRGYAISTKLIESKEELELLKREYGKNCICIKIKYRKKCIDALIMERK